jgi:hypothetical protein
MLVGPRQEERVVAQQTMAPGNDVGRNRCIGMPDVRASVDIVDRGSEIELLPGHGVPRLSLSGRSGVVLADNKPNVQERAEPQK